MRIGELAARTGVSRRLLRYYEEQGLLHSERAANGYRDYGEDALLRVRQIRALLEAGLTTATIRVMLPCVHGPDAAVEASPEAFALLDAELACIDARIDGLRDAREALAAYRERMARPDRETPATPPGTCSLA
ncbi:MerR family transcriptional regulator [Spirillospora sp. NPDC127200]